MSGRSYYVSRMVVALAVGLLFFLGGAAWWQAALAGGVAIAWFLWAPRSGRYRVARDSGVRALRRDERGQSISDRAARNAFAGLMVATGTIAVYAGVTGLPHVPSLALDGLVIVGMLVYFGSDFWLRRLP